MFSATAAGEGKGKSKGGPTAPMLKADVERLVAPAKWPAGAAAKSTMNKPELLELYMKLTENICDETSAPLRAAAEKEHGVNTTQVDPHKTTDGFDYHGNFTAARFEGWFEYLCKQGFEHIAGRKWNDKDEQRYLDALKEFNGNKWLTFDYSHPAGDDFDACPGLVSDDEEERPQRGVLFQLNGAKYHRRVTNPSPTKSTARTEMVAWLQANHPAKITEEQAAKTGAAHLTIAKLFEIIEPLKPKKEFAMYDIARKYGHEVRQ